MAPSGQCERQQTGDWQSQRTSSQNTSGQVYEVTRFGGKSVCSAREIAGRLPSLGVPDGGRGPAARPPQRPQKRCTLDRMLGSEHVDDGPTEYDADLSEEAGYSGWEPRPFPLRRWMLIGGTALVILALLAPALLRLLA